MAVNANPRRGALDGLRVVDLTRVLAGPLCTQMLADHGADVIKVEPPAGDETRRLGPPFDAAGNAAYFSALNRGKRSIALDLSSDADRAVLLRLLGQADLLVENFLPGTMERWGLGFEQALAPRFPRLVYCAISGFGADGPLGGAPGYDAVVQAICGLMSVNGEPASGTTRIGVPIVDHLTAYVATVGLLMALRERDRTGIGQRVEATLFDTALSLLLPHAANFLHSGAAPQLLGSAHPNIAPYDKFRASDGEVFIGILNDGQFRRFALQLGSPGLAADRRYATNGRRLEHREELRRDIEQLIGGLPAQTLCDALMQAGVPAGPVNSVPQALAHAHALHREAVISQDGYRGLRSPVRLATAPLPPVRLPPRLSEHRRQILAEVGLDCLDGLDGSGSSGGQVGSEPI